MRCQCTLRKQHGLHYELSRRRMKGNVDPRELRRWEYSMSIEILIGSIRTVN